MARRVLLPALLLAAISLRAQETLSLSLEDCTARALETDAALQRRAIDLETSRISAANLWAELFPSVSVSASVSYEDSPAEPKKTFPAGVEYRVPLDLTLTLSSVLPVPLTMKMTKLAYETRLAEWQTERRAVSIRVAQNFYTLLVDQENIALMEEIQAIAERQLDKDTAQFQSGLTNELTVLRSQLSVENARFNVNKARRDWEQNTAVFLSGAGFTDAQINRRQIRLTGTVAIEPLSLDADRLIDTYLPARPDVAAAVLEIRRLELNAAKTTLTQRGPVVSLSGTYRGVPAGGDLSGASLPFSDSLSARLSVSVPLDAWIPGSKGAQAAAQAAAETEKARISLQNLQQNANNTIRSIVENMENTLSSIEIARLRAEIAERAFRMSETAFERGAMEILDYENSRASWAQSRQDLLREQLAYKTLTLELEKALNIDSISHLAQ
jgi:outer membrane protein TolC